MKKIPTLFQRSEDRRTVIDAVTPGCEWVLRGEGRATRKYDGTCVRLVRVDELAPGEGVSTSSGSHELWMRREVKRGGNLPPHFIREDDDAVTGKTFGWEPAELSGFFRYLVEALEGHDDLPSGTYELCGPKIQGNPEGFDEHVLVRHAYAEGLSITELSFDRLRDWLQSHRYEGIVWHHPDGRTCKLKKRDFGRAA